MGLRPSSERDSEGNRVRRKERNLDMQHFNRTIRLSRSRFRFDCETLREGGDTFISVTWRNLIASEDEF